MTLGILRRIHRWLGLLLAVPLVLQGLSGTILALEPVLADFAARFAAVRETRDVEPRSAGAVVAAAQAVAPTGMRPVRYIPARTPGDQAMVHFMPQSGPRGRGLDVRIDPVSLAVLGQEPAGVGPIGWIKAFHTNLLTTDRSGRSVIGWLGVGLLILAVLGVPLWWPRSGRWRPAFTIDARATGVRFHRRLHGAVGIWGLALLMATAMTGVVLAFPQTARGALGLPVTAGSRPPRPVVRPETVAAIDMDRAVAVAAGAAQGLRLRAVLLPASATDPVRVLLIPPDADGVASMVTVSVDASTGRLAAVQDSRTMPLAEKALRWAHDLHFGQGFGSVWQALTIVTGLFLPVFAVTGCAMWLLRRRRRATTHSFVTQPGE